MKWMRLLSVLSVTAFAGLMTACDEDTPTEPDATAPGAPAGVTATANGATITVTWSSANGATSYRVVLTTSGESDRSTTTTETTASFDGLTQGVTYAAQVFAINSAGETAGGVSTADVEEAEPTFVLVDGDIFNHPGPRLVQAARILAKALHPDAF